MHKDTKARPCGTKVHLQVVLNKPIILTRDATKTIKQQNIKYFVAICYKMIIMISKAREKQNIKTKKQQQNSPTETHLISPPNQPPLCGRIFFAKNPPPLKHKENKEKEKSRHKAGIEIKKHRTKKRRTYAINPLYLVKTA